jgi:hypothetical protein
MTGYTPQQRLAHMRKFIASMAAEGPDALERTISSFVSITYGVPVETVKAEKARHRNELSFRNGEGK